MRYTADSPQMPFCSDIPYTVVGKALYELPENIASFSTNEKSVSTSESFSQTVLDPSSLQRKFIKSIGTGADNFESSLAQASSRTIEPGHIPLLRESLRSTGTVAESIQTPPLQEPFRTIGAGVEDEQLQKAARESAESGSVLPIIKQELKYKILSKRLSRGEEDIDVEFKPKPECPLTPEEIERKNRRKESNRKSARKCRLKQKRSGQQLKKDLLLEQQRHRKLLQDIETLTKQKEILSSNLPSSLTEMCSVTADVAYGLEQNYGYRSETAFNFDFTASQYSLLVS